MSPLPLQKGAAMVAKAGRIKHVQLRPESTREQWIAEIEKVTHIGITDKVSVTMHDSFQIRVLDGDGNVVDGRAG